jgi:hypothetical protein
MFREMRYVRRGRLGEGEVPVVTDGGEFGRRSLLSCGGSARDSVGLSGFPHEREKGGKEGAPRLYIGAINLKNKLGFGSGRGEIDGQGGLRAGEGEFGQGKVMTCGPHMSAGERGKIRTGLVLNDFGPWAASGLGRNGFPRGLFFFFFILFHFFLFFLFLSYLLQNLLKSIHSNS